jgi:hypothetical protein
LKQIRGIRGGYDPCFAVSAENVGQMITKELVLASAYVRWVLELCCVLSSSQSAHYICVYMKDAVVRCANTN